jgi:hypothetical protein
MQKQVIRSAIVDVSATCKKPPTPNPSPPRWRAPAFAGVARGGRGMARRRLRFPSPHAGAIAPAVGPGVAGRGQGWEALGRLKWGAKCLRKDHSFLRVALIRPAAPDRHCGGACRGLWSGPLKNLTFGVARTLPEMVCVTPSPDPDAQSGPGCPSPRED